MTWAKLSRERQLELNATARAERAARRAAKPASDGPIDKLRRRYGIRHAPAQLLAALAATPDDQPTSRAFLARCFGRSHQPHCVGPALSALRKAGIDGIQTSRAWGVTLSPELREELRAVLA